MIETDRVAQRVELELRQLARIADPQSVKRQVREGDALELVDEKTECLDHPVDLAVLTLVDRDREPAVLALARKRLHVGRHRHRAVVELNAVAQELELILVDLAVNLDVIRLRDVARRRE